MSTRTCVRRSPRPEATASTSPDGAPRHSASVGSTRSGSRRGERDEHGSPLRVVGETRSSIAKRVFPVPPGPRTESTRGSRSYTSDTTRKSSRSRPRNLVVGVGQLDGSRCSKRREGLVAELAEPRRPSKSFRRRTWWRATRARGATRPSPASRPPGPRARARRPLAPRCTSIPTYPSHASVGSPCRPMRTEIGPKRSAS